MLANIKTWVLLRGLSREQQHWGEFLNLCRHRFPDKQFITLDLPGCGIYHHQQSPLSITKIRRHLQFELQKNHHQELAQGFGIIGLSLGAMVALDWLQHDHQRVAAVVVMNTSANNFPPFWRFKFTALGTALRTLLAKSVAQREANILQLVSQQHGVDQQVLMQWQTIQQQRPVSVVTFFRQLIAAARFSLPDFFPKTSVLVLASSNDGMVSSECSKKIAERYAWPLALNNLAGHDLTLDQPVWVVDQLQQWWQADDCS